MIDLHSRILLWHKLLAMQTGSLALCSARHRLNRDEARGWSAAARNVADDIDAFLRDGTFILDDQGQRMVSLPDHVALAQPKSDGPTPRTATGASGTTGRKAGGLRIATRKTK